MLPPIDHVVEGTSKVISQYRDKPKFMTRVACYLFMLQRIEDAFQALSTAFNVDTATGFRLDWVGRKVGQPRIGSDDSVYRIYIKARIRANRSRGKIADLQAVADLLLHDWAYFEGPQYIQVETNDNLTLEGARAVYSLLHDAKPAGPTLFLLYGTEEPEFQWGYLAADPALPGGLDTIASVDLSGLFSKVIGPKDL
jgi:hypothetical protein